VKIFISWSGEKSQSVAQTLHDWLPLVIQSLEPFMSSEDIEAGRRWSAEVAGQLDATNFGLVCVTGENQAAPWLNFEAGALAKAMGESNVVPLLVDLKPTDLRNPLGQFQALAIDRAGITKVLQAINGAAKQPLAADVLDRLPSDAMHDALKRAVGDRDLRISWDSPAE